MTSNKNFGRQPVRFTGRHFTKDQSLIQQMIKEAQINKTDMVLDIGAGKGALTKPLSHAAERVVAIERDKKLADHLKCSFQEQPNVNVLNMDFRKMPLPNHPFKVVSNIPYAITTEIFGKLMDTPETCFRKGVFIIEMGAARRFTQIKQSDPRIIGWNTSFDIKVLQKVSRGAFSPPPRVTSAMIKINRREKPAVQPEQYRKYIAFVTSLLEQPHMYARESLRSVFNRNQVRRIMQDCGIGRYDHMRNLSIPQWIHCFQTMLKLIPKRIHPGMPGKYRKLYKR